MAGEPAQKARPNKMEATEERHLIEAAQRDPVCFAGLYESYFELVYVFVARRVRNRAETEDLTADVFRKALANLPRFKWTGAPFAAWLFRIASNMIADRAKQAAREGSVPANEDGPDSRGPQPQQMDLEQTERSATLFRLVSELAEDQYRVLVMRFVEERSIREIADTLGRTEGAVKQLQWRALENVRKRLAKGE